MAQIPNLSPSALIGMVRVTLMVLFGRRPAIGSFNTSPQGLWQAVASSVIFTILVTIYPALEATPRLFISAIILQFIGIMLLVLVFDIFLRAIDRPAKFLPFAVPFLWIENMQQLLGGIIQNIVVITGDQSVMVLILLIAIWTCYWLWRIGRDIVGKGGWVAASFIALSFVIDVALLYMLQARLL
ncbi:hypothetical protein OAJ84_03025 [Candidatus Puniceispirillum sp.]|nr:hypothetical protein [Candidatus Puniceispirillum sp.]